MAKDTSPQCKQCRREAEKLFLKGERCLTAESEYWIARPYWSDAERAGLKAMGRFYRAYSCEGMKFVNGIIASRAIIRYYVRAAREVKDKP